MIISKKTKFTGNIHSADTELGEKNRLMQEFTELSNSNPGGKTALENEKEALDILEKEIKDLERRLSEFKAEKQALEEKLGEKKALSDPDYIYKLLDSINDGISLRYKQDKHVILDRSYNKHLKEDKNKDIPEEKKLQPIEFINIEEKLEDEKETLDKEKESLNAEEGLLNLQQAALDVSKKEIDDNKEKWRDKIYKREFVKYIDKKTKFLIEDKLGHDLRTESYNYRLDDYNSKCEQYKKHIKDQKETVEEQALKDIPEELKATIESKADIIEEAIVAPVPVIPVPAKILPEELVTKTEILVEKMATASSDEPSFDVRTYDKINSDIAKGMIFREGDGSKTGRADQVKLIQQNLKDLGYDLGTSGPNKDGVDGGFGNFTKKALEKFQEDHGLNKTGKYDAATNEMMICTILERHSLNVLKDSKISEAEYINSGYLVDIREKAININKKVNHNRLASQSQKETFASASYAFWVENLQYAQQEYESGASTKDWIKTDVDILIKKIDGVKMTPELENASKEIMKNLLNNELLMKDEDIKNSVDNFKTKLAENSKIPG